MRTPKPKHPAGSERPILFSAPMIRAILAGTKSQTRRVVKENIMRQAAGKMMEGEEQEWCPYGRVKDRLWVRETWAPCIGGPCEPSNPVLYRADALLDYERLTWKPSIFMPRWASRITLEITGVRVEKLNDISEADAIAEGAPDRTGYMEIWEAINGLESWHDNKWVWVVEFKRVKP